MQLKVNYEKIQLTNGSSLGVVTLPGVYPVTISAFIQAGFRYDPPDKPGLAHFTEHMFFNGSKKYPSSSQLAQATSQLGGWHSAFTWIEYQYHTIHLPQSHFEKGLGILLDTLKHPIINHKEIKKEKGVIKEEIYRGRTNPEKVIWDYAWQPLFFEGTSLARPYSGSEKDVDNFTLEDINNFIENHFVPKSTTFVVAGDVDPQRAAKIFEKQITDYKRSGKPNQNSEIGSNSNKRIEVFKADLEQTTFMYGFRTVPYKDSERHILNLALDILAGHFGARLPQRLREENGLIYNWTSWQDNLDETGYLFFRSSTAPKNTQKFLKIVFEEFEKIATLLIDERELKVSKGHLTGSLFSNTETGSDFLNWYGHQEILQGNSISLDKQAKIYQSISAQEVLNTASRFFRKDNFYIAAVGPTTEEEIKAIADSF